MRVITVVFICLTLILGTFNCYKLAEIEDYIVGNLDSIARYFEEMKLVAKNFGIITGTLFITLALGLIISNTILISVLNKDFE